MVEEKSGSSDDELLSPPAEEVLSFTMCAMCIMLHSTGLRVRRSLPVA